MINSTDFSDRIKLIMDYYQLTAAAFAEKIKVQPSSISHLLSGRNKPSLEFVLKVLETFKDVDLYWLLNGKGSFPKDASQLSNKENIIKMKEGLVDNNIDRIIIFFKDGTFKNYIP